MNRNIDITLQGAVARGDVAGVVAMAAEAGGTIYEGAFGERQLGNGIPMTSDTVFWMASMTKAITGAAVMQLVEQKRIGLDDDVGQRVPSLANPRVLDGFDPDGSPRLRPARGAITLRRLLTHTAGFVYDIWNADMRRYMAHTKVPRAATFERPECCLPLAFDPGTRWEYGINIDWAGKVLEAVTGAGLEEYLQTCILKPMRMESTGYFLKPGIEGRLAGMHQRRSDGALVATPYSAPQEPSQFTGGGGLYGTAGDYLRFIRALLNGGALDGARILLPETVQTMAANHIGDLSVVRMPSARQDLSHDAEFFPRMRKTWGLSFLINMEDVPDGRAAGSLAWAGLFNTYFWIDLKSGIGGVLMAQLLPFADPAALRLLTAFERETYATIRR